MFNRIMENSMAIWMLVSIAFPVFCFGTIIKAILHFRKSRIRAEYVSLPAMARSAVDAVAGDDWVPSR